MATSYLTPGVYVEEVSGGAKPISAVGSSTPGFVGVAPDAGARVNEAVAINTWSQFMRQFVPEKATSTPLTQAVHGFFLNGGRRCWVVNVGERGAIAGGGRERTGIDVLETIDEVAIVAAPGAADPVSWDAVLSHCEKLGDRVAILDPPADVADIERLTRVAAASAPRRGRTGGGGAAEGGEEQGAAAGAQAPRSEGAKPRESKYGSFYFPWVTVRDPLSGELISVPPSGHVAGIWARSDSSYGVHKAPANEAVRGAVDLAYRLTRDEQGTLNEAGVNCLRFFDREGIRVWGARTISADPEWRYLNVRRLFNMIGESIARDTKWIVFQSNDYQLWQGIKRDVGAFLTLLWRQGALFGRTAEEAFFVRCDEEINPPEAIDAGQVNVLVGIAPVKPAEFIIFRLTQYAGGAQVTEGESNG